MLKSDCLMTLQPYVCIHRWAQGSQFFPLGCCSPMHATSTSIVVYQSHSVAHKRIGDRILYLSSESQFGPDANVTFYVFKDSARKRAMLLFYSTPDISKAFCCSICANHDSLNGSWVLIQVQRSVHSFLNIYRTCFFLSFFSRDCSSYRNSLNIASACQKGVGYNGNNEFDKKVSADILSITRYQSSYSLMLSPSFKKRVVKRITVARPGKNILRDKY